MASYVNPAGSPPVEFAGPVRFTNAQIAAACRAWGKTLDLTPVPGVDGAQLLWALAGNESSFGANCLPRHEAAYCTGRYSTVASVVQLTKQYGHAAHCSFGPWQTMLVNAGALSTPAQFQTASLAAMVAAGFINREILRRQGATTLEQIADAYNSGNFRDGNVPTAYIEELLHHYHDVPMPADAVS